MALHPLQIEFFRNLLGRLMVCQPEDDPTNPTKRALNNGGMDFYTDEIPHVDGKNRKRHLQFFNLGPDKVRQFSQGSNDGGKTWFVEYDFTYDRKK